MADLSSVFEAMTMVNHISDDPMKKITNVFNTPL